MANGSSRLSAIITSPYSLLATRYSPLSPLRHRAIIKAAVEPVLVAADVLLHRDVDEGLIQRDARDVAVGEVDEALHVGVVGRGVTGRGSIPRPVDQLVHLRRL